MNKKNLAIALITSVGLSTAALASVALAHGPRHMGGRFFDAMDTNKDGKVTLAEAKAGAQARFASMDTNKDGRVTAQELEAHHAAKRAEHAKGPEKAAREGRGEKHKQRGAKFFAKLDTNGDGAIDAAESAAKAEKMFTRMDANSDGVVTKDELGRGGDCHKGRGHGAHEGAAGSGPRE